MAKKILLLVIDGLSETPIPALKGRTPLGAARTPNLNFMAENGLCGLINPFWFKEQEYPRSDTAHLALLGYHPAKYYLKRGPYEVAGIGMDLRKGDVALRANFGTVDKNFVIKDRRAGRMKMTEPLVKALEGIEIEGVRFFIKKSYGHRAGLVLRGKNLSDRITDGDPHKKGVKANRIAPLVKDSKAEFTARVLQKYLEKAHEILEDHPLNRQRKKQKKLPANFLLVRGAGQVREVPSFKKMHGLKAVCVAGGGLYGGIGRLLGMELVKVKGDTGLPNTNLKGKFLAAKRSLKKCDFVFCHVKPTDNFAEDGDYAKKKNFISKIDRNIKPLLKLKGSLVVVTGDHSTCCLLKRHCTNPVPVLVFGAGKDRVKEFSEKACCQGSLKKIEQIKLMPLILRLAGRA